MKLNIDNIYATLSHLHFLYKLVILRDNTIQDIHKTSFKKRILKMTKPILEPNYNQINTPIHHDNLVLKNAHVWHKLFENKIEKTIEINDEVDDATNDKNVIHYWHEEFQLTQEDETILLYPYGWLNDQHMGAIMQMLYINKLQSIKYELHTYAIIGRINRIMNKAPQHIFDNNNHWILVEIHKSTPCSHCTIYD